MTYTNAHIHMLQEQIARTQRELSGWQALLDHAVGFAPCACGKPHTPGVQHNWDGAPCIDLAAEWPVERASQTVTRNPYPPAVMDTKVFPPAPPTPFDPRTQEAAHRKFDELHDSLCGDDNGPEGSFTCVLERFHNSLCDDNHGNKWARRTQPTAGG